MIGALPRHLISCRTRGLAKLACAAALAIAFPLSFATSAGAVTTSVHVVFAGTLLINGTTPVEIDGINGTADGTVDDAGNLTLPKASISFPPFPAALVGGTVDTVITIQPTAAWAGTIDKHSGAVNIHAPLIAHIDLSSVFPADTDCPVGPLDLNLTTGTSGSVTGSPLNFATGTAGVVDGTFAIPAFPDSPNCGDASELTSLAGLPLPAGVSTARFNVTFTPKQPVPPAPPEAPNAVADSAKTSENTAVTVNVLANDTPGPAGLPINPDSLSISKAPANGAATVNTDHTITYKPKTGFSGLDFFTYELCSQPTATTSTTTTSTTTTSPAIGESQTGSVRTAAQVAPACAHATVTVTVVSPTPLTTAVATTTTTTTATTATVAAAAQLPRTGSTSRSLTFIGLGLVVGGLSATAFAKSRRRTQRIGERGAENGS
jgi:LPXTG-motif cell wall-anchored protein